MANDPTDRFRTPTAPIVGFMVVGVAAALIFLNNGSGETRSNLDAEYQRNSYPTEEACIADYDPEVCTERDADGAVPGAGLPDFLWVGPWYRSDWRTQGVGTMAGPGRTALANPAGAVTTPVETYRPRSASAAPRRGGFGSTGRYYSARGG